jgi:hypothetical protein
MRMKVGCVVLMFLFCSSIALAQYKSSAAPQPTVSESIIKPDGGGLLFGWFDPSRLSMHQSFSLSYQTFGRQGMSLGVYTNSLMYKISNALDVQADISLMHSPFNSFGKQFQNNLNGIFLSRAELNYRPSENTLFQISFHQLPSMYYWGGGYGLSGYYSGFDQFGEEKR